MRSIPPITSTGGPRLRSADPRRFRTRPQEQSRQQSEQNDPYGAGYTGERESRQDDPTVSAQQYEKPERRRPLGCITCGGTNINGAEEHDGSWYVWCVACDSRQPASVTI